MGATELSHIRNRLLALLPHNELQQVGSALSPIELPKGFVVVEPDRPIDFVYFPTSGIGSVVTVSPEGHRAEAGLFGRFIHAFGSQISFTALSNAVHNIDERLARWLLMCHDRVDGNEILLTHEFISLMLAVRRPSVTTALHILEGKKLIRAERGRITVRDRAGLESFAGDVYGKPEEEYRRLIGEL
jgi:CRP-like cAMP-binding protein